MIDSLSSPPPVHQYEVLPRIVESSGIGGETDANVFGARVPLAGIAGDQQAAMFGELCTEVGAAKITASSPAKISSTATRLNRYAPMK